MARPRPASEYRIENQLLVQPVHVAFKRYGRLSFGFFIS
jgi:hypothetical protein